MKTIFITIFEGVEAKNILRTPILSTLLSDKDVRVVLFTKSEERVEYYRGEFKDPRIIYEVVAKPKVQGLDKFFSELKFTLLNTKTMAMRKRMVFEETGGRTKYYSSRFSSFLLARSFIRRIARTLDYLLVRNAMYAPFFEKYEPDLVFMAHLFDEPEVHLLREAKRRGVRTVGFVNSWDKVTARAMMRLLPDRAVVFNEIVKQEIVELNDINPEHIFVGGIPQYDFYFSKTKKSREEFMAKIHADPKKELIVYAPMGSTFSASDWAVVDLLHDMARANRFKKPVEILVRFQPNDFIDEKYLKERPYLRYDYPGKRFAVSRGVDWDMSSADLEHLRDTLTYMSLVVCYASSIGIDAAVFGKPCININFKTDGNIPASKSPTQFYQMTHYRRALATGGIRLVNTPDELVEWINRYLENGNIDSESRNRLVKEQCQFTDGKSGERIGKFLLSEVNSDERKGI